MAKRNRRAPKQEKEISPPRPPFPIRDTANNILIVLIFILIGIGLDRLTGMLLGKLYRHAISSNSDISFNKVNLLKPEILVLGDSRAAQHYDSAMIAGVTGKSVFNCGSPGRGIMHMLLGFESIKKTYLPPVIVIDFNVKQVQIFFDRYKQELELFSPDMENLPSYNHMRAFYEQYTGDKTLLRKISYSHCFRFNAKAWMLVSGTLFCNDHDLADLGFHPSIPGTSSVNWGKRQAYSVHMDANQFCYLIHLIQGLHDLGVQPVVCMGPYYWEDSNFLPGRIEREALLGIMQICKELKVPCVEISIDKYPELKLRALWDNHDHLNANGAQIFSRIFAAELKKILALKTLDKADAIRYIPQISPAEYIIPAQYLTMKEIPVLVHKP